MDASVFAAVRARRQSDGARAARPGAGTRRGEVPAVPAHSIAAECTGRDYFPAREIFVVNQRAQSRGGPFERRHSARGRNRSDAKDSSWAAFDQYADRGAIRAFAPSGLRNGRNGDRGPLKTAALAALTWKPPGEPRHRRLKANSFAHGTELLRGKLPRNSGFLPRPFASFRTRCCQGRGVASLRAGCGDGAGC